MYMSKKAAATPENTPGKNSLIKNLVEFRDYLDLSRLELRKVTWPSKKETKITTIAVLIFVVVMSIFLSVVDFGLAKLIGLVLT
jgi:preprotein translocase subunit SecE